MLGHVVHEIGLSVLISKYSFIAGLVLKRQPGEKTEFEGNIPLDQRWTEQTLPPSNSLSMLYGLTAQQDISAKKFNQHFFQLQHCQVAEPWRRSLLPKFAIQILPAALLCFLNRDTKLRFFPKRGSALQLPSEGFSFPVDTLSHRRSCTRHG